jgi:hyperosmotically inducible periplasmic protein
MAFKYGWCLALLLCLEGCVSTISHESSGEYLDDSVITARVKTSLLKAKAIRSGDVKVATYRGVVQLSGFVNTPTQLFTAGRLASDVPGVVRVHNDLMIKTNVH